MGVLAVRCHSLVGPRHIGIKAGLFRSFVGVAALHTWRVSVTARGLECGPGRLALFCAIRSGRLRCFAIVEPSSDLLLGGEFWICSWWGDWSSGRSCLGLRLRTSLCVSSLLLLLLPVLCIIHVLPCLESILTLSCRVRALRRRCWAWEVCEAICSSRLWSLVCAWLRPSGWWRICRSCLIWIASSATAATAAAAAHGIQTCLASVAIVSAFLTWLT